MPPIHRCSVNASSGVNFVSATIADVCPSSGIRTWVLGWQRVSESLIRGNSVKEYVLLGLAGGSWLGFLFLQSGSLLDRSHNNVVFGASSYMVWRSG